MAIVHPDMGAVMPILIALVVAQAAPVATGRKPPLAAPMPASCRYDKAAMLALDERAFDQTMSGGWRALASAGCDLAAADAIQAWRAAHGGEPRTAGLLNWHEGQLRANAGQTAPAIALFETARKAPAEDAAFGWNLYVDGSIAFLRRDLAGLDAARARLAALPRPPGYAPVGVDGKPRAFAWPMNLNILDGLVACWNRGYKQAYACAKPAVRTLPTVP